MSAKPRFRNSVDNYRAQYSALNPTARSLLLFSVGLLLGLVVLGWVIMPVRWMQTYPVDMRQEYRDIYLETVADSYALNGDIDLAAARVSPWESNQIVAILYRRAQALDDEGKSDEAERVRALAGDLDANDVGGSADATASPISRDTLQLILYGAFGLLALAVLFVVLKSVYDSRRHRDDADKGDWPQFEEFVDPATSQPRPSRVAQPSAPPSPATKTPPPVAAPPPATSVRAEADGLDLRTTQTAPAISQPAATADAGSASIRAAYEATMREVGPAPAAAGAMGLGGGAAEKVSYSAGIDNFNHAFRIEERGVLLGEYGVGIGVGSAADPNEALTMEVWLFDKSDINAVSGVLMHPDIYANEGRREELVGGNNVPIPLKPGETFRLHTRTLEVVGKVISASFASAQREGVPIRAMEIEILGRPLHA